MEVQKLVDDIIVHAKNCLNEAGGFYPFASVIDPHGNISPIDGFSMDEQVSPAEVLYRLEKEMRTLVAMSKVNGFAIGSNLNTTLKEGQVKIKAIYIRVDHIREGNSNYLLPYDSSDGKGLEFYQLVPIKGTLKVFP